MTLDQLASQASSLLTNDAFIKALTTIRTEALEALAAADATNADVIRDHQAAVRVVDEISARLKQDVRSGAPKPPFGVA